MTFDSIMLTLSWAMDEALQGTVLLLCALMCIGVLYLLFLHLVRAFRARLGWGTDAASNEGM